MKRSIASAVLALAVLSAFAPGRAAAQVLFATNYLNGTVGAYDANTGTAINPSFVNGVSSPYAVATLNNTLYVSDLGTYKVTAYNPDGTAAAGFAPINTGSNQPRGLVASNALLYVSGNAAGSSSNGTITAYSAVTGQAVPTFMPISGFPDPEGLALGGTTLYVADGTRGTVGTYNALTGQVLDASFLSGLGTPSFLTLSGTTLYVALHDKNLIAAYNATTGAALAGFTSISDPNAPAGLAVAGNNLFVANEGNNTVSEYDATTGALVNANFVTGLNLPFGLAVAVPEPRTWTLLAAGAAGLGLAALRRRARANAPA